MRRPTPSTWLGPVLRREWHRLSLHQGALFLTDRKAEEREVRKALRAEERDPKVRAKERAGKEVLGVPRMATV